jgi:hypothetical protein
MGSLGNVQVKSKKFNTELTDYSESHAAKTGPYADDLDIDALIIGGGFGEYTSLSLPLHTHDFVN